MGYKKQIQDLKELEEMGVHLIEDEQDTVAHRLQEILKEKGLLISDLSKLTGISRQNINAVMRNKMKPSIEFVLKVSYVLNLEKVNDLFRLTDNAWYKPYSIEGDLTTYLNTLTMTILDTKERKLEKAYKDKEYYDVHTKELLDKKTYEARLQKRIANQIDSETDLIRESILSKLKSSGKYEQTLEQMMVKYPNLEGELLDEKIIHSIRSANTIKSQAIEKIKQEFSEGYSKIYKKLGVPFEPYVIE